MSLLPCVDKISCSEFPPLKSGPPILWTGTEERVFRNNEGDGDFVDTPDMVLTAGDTIEFFYLAYISLSGSNVFFCDRVSGSGDRAALLFNSSGFLNNFPSWVDSREDDGVVVGTDSVIPTDGKIHHIKVTVDSSSTGKIINRLMASENGAGGYKGIMYDFKHKSSTGALVKHYPMDDPKGTSTVRELVSGANGTVINGSDDDKQTFKKEGFNWAGQEVAVNSDFASAIGWTLGVGWSIAGGVAQSVAITNTTLLQAVALTVGLTYRTTFNIVSYTSGNVQGGLDGLLGAKRSAIGTYSETLSITNASTSLLLSADLTTGFVGSIGSVSVKAFLEAA